jgi:hypothetical protein
MFTNAVSDSVTTRGIPEEFQRFWPYCAVTKKTREACSRYMPAGSPANSKKPNRLVWAVILVPGEPGTGSSNTLARESGWPVKFSTTVPRITAA